MDRLARSISGACRIQCLPGRFDLVVVPQQEATAKSPRDSQPEDRLCGWAALEIAPISSTCSGSRGPCSLVMAIALSVAALLLGALADSLRRLGKNMQKLLAIIAALFIAVGLALILYRPFLSLPWIVVTVVGSANRPQLCDHQRLLSARMIARKKRCAQRSAFRVGFPRRVRDGVNSRAMAGKGRTLPLNRAHQTAFGIKLCCSWSPRSGSLALGSKS
ncbi:hypothetical protein ABIB06_007679 [Bradyrhizobium sp. LB8.2]